MPVSVHPDILIIRIMFPWTENTVTFWTLRSIIATVVFMTILELASMLVEYFLMAHLPMLKRGIPELGQMRRFFKKTADMFNACIATNGNNTMYFPVN